MWILGLKELKTVTVFNHAFVLRDNAFKGWVQVMRWAEFAKKNIGYFLRKTSIGKLFWSCSYFPLVVWKRRLLTGFLKHIFRFDFRVCTNTQGLKITEEWRYCLCPANSSKFAWLRRSRKMAVRPVSSSRRKNIRQPWSCKYRQKILQCENSNNHRVRFWGDDLRSYGYRRGTQREYSSKPFKHSIVKRIQ